MGVLVYNRLKSTDYHVVVEHPPVFTFPERDYEKVHVPGRNGDVVIDNGSYLNVKAKYDICFGSYFAPYYKMVYPVSRWLHSAQGQYVRLEDTYDLDHFRYALYLEENEFENIMMHAGKASIEFECKPQRFLKSGEHEMIFSKSPGTILNPTLETALPLIMVSGSGSGSFQIGQSIMVVDSDLEDSYIGPVNKNPVTTVTNGFPKLYAGENGISFTDGITGLTIVPRWWEL